MNPSNPTLDVIEVLMWAAIIGLLLATPVLFIGWMDLCQKIIQMLGW